MGKLYTQLSTIVAVAAIICCNTTMLQAQQTYGNNVWNASFYKNTNDFNYGNENQGSTPPSQNPAGAVQFDNATCSDVDQPGDVYPDDDGIFFPDVIFNDSEGEGQFGPLGSFATGNDIAINFDWGLGDPCNGPTGSNNVQGGTSNGGNTSGSDNFTTSYRMTRNFTGCDIGVYEVVYNSFDGIRITTEGTGGTENTGTSAGLNWNVVNNLNNNTTSSGSPTVALSGTKNIRVDHREYTGQASLSVDFNCIAPQVGPSVVQLDGDGTCISSTDAVSLSFSGGYTGFPEWQSSTNGGASWTNTGVTSNDYDPTPGVTTIYRVKYSSCTCQFSDVFSNQVTITVNNLNAALTLATDEACNNSGLVQLINNGYTLGAGESESWSISPNVLTSFSGLHFFNTGSANPSTTYTVTYTVTDANGCTDFATQVFDVLPLPNVSLNLSGVQLGTCSAPFNLSGLTANHSPNDTGVNGQWSVDGGAPSTNGSVNPAALGAGSYPVTYTFTDVNGCTNSASSTLVIDNNPTVNAGANVTICEGASTTLTASGTGRAPLSYAWNNGAGAGASVNVSPTSSTTYTVTITDGNNCTTTDNVTVTVNPAPIVNSVSPDVTICLGESTTLTASASGAASYSWNNGGGSGASVSVNPTTTTTYTVTATSAAGCSDLTTDQVTVTVDPLPAVTLDLSGGNNAVVCEPARNLTGNSPAGGVWSGTGITDAVNGTFDPGTAGVGTHTITYTYTDPGTGCVNSESDTYTVIADNVPPTANCVDITAQLDASGNVALSAASIAGTSTDLCGIAAIAFDPGFTLPVAPGTCANLGVTNFTVFVLDNSGNASSCTANVTLEDNVAPTAVCQDITVQLDGAGNASITTGDVDNGSGDNCSSNLSIDVNSFTCANVGPNNVILTNNDGQGQSANCTAIVTVQDNEAPTASCNDLTVQLDAAGNASWTTGAVDNGSSDNCGVASLSLDVSSANCAQAGTVVTSTLTVTDDNGNSSTCASSVTVQDNVAPAAVCQDITVQLNASGAATITAASVDGGSSDACGLQPLAIDVTAFNCTNVGTNNVVLTATDNNSNSASCTAIVTVQDNVAPVALCNDVTIALDASGNASTSVGAINNGSSDACGLASVTLDNEDFACADVGIQTVTLTVTDLNGNSSSCTGNVTVEDNLAPVVNCTDITVSLSAGGTVSIAAADVGTNSENCGVSLENVSPSSFDCNNIGGNVVTYTVSDINGNSTNCSATVTVQDNTAPNAVCQNISIDLNAAGSASIMANDIDGGSTDNCGVDNISASPTSFTCANVGANTVTLTVNDPNGNSSTCTATVTVNDVTAPVAVCQDITISLDAAGNTSITDGDVNNGSSDACGIASTTIDVSAFTCANVGPNTVTLTVTDNNTNSSTCTSTVTVEDNTNPLAVCQDITLQLNAAGAGSITADDIDGGSSDACGVASTTASITSFGCTDVGTVSVDLTVTDNNGNSSTCTATVTVEDNVPPSALCQDINISLDGAGTATIVAGDVDAGSNDACGVATTTIDVSSFACADTGANVITLSVTDVNGNSSTCTSTVNVSDDTNPTALCQDITIQLDAGGVASITGADIDGGSSDNCGVDVLTASQTGFNCSHVGINTVTLIVSDPSENESTCSASVTVHDNVAPVALCQDITLQLDNTGAGSITAGQVNNSSSDACGIASLSLDNTSFACGDIGANTVTLTVTDNNTNAASCTATITVQDNIAPVALCQPVGIDLDAAGNASITTGDVDAGSNDACGIASLSLDNASFNCSNVGGNTVTLTVTDVNGNSSSCTATITVEDNVAPAAVCADITVDLDNTGNTSIVAGDVDGGSTDACGIASTSVSPNTFNCGDIGANTVTLTITDVNGNVSNCTATVTVEDNVDPIAICQDVTLQLNAAGDASITASTVNNGSNDACGIASTSVDQTAFDCSSVGTNTVTLTVTDNNGNNSTCIATVTVEDNIDPTALCVDITVQLDAAGVASITTTDVDAGSNDACGVTLSIDNNSFDCGDVGNNTVTLTVNDPNGNSSTCISTVAIQDNVAPIAVCQDLTVQLDATGNAFVGTGDIDNGSSDACGILSLELAPQDFTCTDVGVNTVTLTVTDNNSNATSCTATVTVEDNVDPVAVCNDIIVQLDATGNVSIVPADVDASTDACGIVNSVLDLTAFTCSNVGIVNTVTLTVTDANGNTDQCTATITVQDNVAPVAVCKDITIQLDASGAASIAAADIDNGSSDACGVASLVADIVAFDCTSEDNSPITVTLTVTDVNSNSSTCTSAVTVQDNVAPVALCQDVTIELSSTTSQGGGAASIIADDIDGGSSDACGIASLSASQTDFDCSHVGPNTVTLTVTDNNGNVSSCDATVTVEDNVAPTLICQDITVQLDADGTLMFDVSLFDNGSYDNCAIASFDPMSFNVTCADVGTYTIMVTVTDVNGNMSACAPSVTLEDNTAPVATCQDITVQLDPTGNTTITTGDVDNGSTDACGIASLAIDDNAFECGDVGANTVTLTVTDNNSNVSTCTSTVTVEDNVAPALGLCPPDVTISAVATGCNGLHGWLSPTSSDACGTATFVYDAPGASIIDVVPGSGSIVSGLFPVGSTVVTYTVTDNNGNATSCDFNVTVTDDTPPTITGCPATDIEVDTDPGQCNTLVFYGPIIASDNCAGTSLTTSATFPDLSVGPVLTSGGTFNLGVTALTFTATDGAGNTTVCTFNITVSDNEAPNAVCKNATLVLDASGNGSIDVDDIDNGSTDNCGIDSRSLDITDFTCSETGANTVTLTVNDVNGNSSTCTGVVTVVDNTAPIALCQDATVDLDATGAGSITTANIDAGSNDACGVSLALDVTSFGCSNIGANTVTLTVTDPSGNSSSCTGTVTVNDNVAPVALCQDVTLGLDAAGAGSITTGDVDNGSNDACGIASLSLDNASFGCADVGANTVELTVTDNNGNTSTCTATVTVEDNVAPSALCQPVVVALDAAGTGSITTTDVDAGSSDACGIASLSLDVTDFGCADVGANTVTLTVTDNNTNVSTCTATVTVNDNVAPVALCQDVTVSLDVAGAGSITTTDVDAGSNDACGIFSLSLDNTSFGCGDVGANTVTLTVTDNNANTSTCTATITVNDNVAPVALCQDVTVSLDAAGAGSITTTDVDAGSNDACGVTLALDNTTFGCGDVGANTVTLTVTDANSNVSTCTATITVNDNVAPVALCQDVTVSLDAAGAGSITTADVDAGSNDACGVTLALDITTFGCGDVGANTVTLTVTDANSNVSTCTATVTVNDNVAPVALCQDVTVSLDAAGAGSITTADVDAGSNDACGVTLALDITTFGCGDVGANTVTLTVTDANSNVSTCTATVTVNDNVAPIALCQDVTVSLDAAGAGSITTTDVDAGSNDACGIFSLSLDNTSFGCTDVGANTVTLTVTDNNTNVSTCTATITVNDNVAPVAVCQNVNVFLDASGDGSITPGDINNGSSDACGIANLALNNSDFDCNNVGTNTVTLTVTDNNGNSANCTATVTVADLIAPVALCQDVDVYLDETGNGSTTATDVDNGSNDACGISSLTLDITDFGCDDIGANPVTLTVMDVNGNISTCGAIVTVLDTIPPVATCQDIIVQLDATGNVTIDADDIDNGSSDACGVANMTVEPDSFNCAHVGGNIATLTVTDNNGNTSTCTSMVTVQDNVAPTALCKNITVVLSAAGVATITANDVDAGSSDACGVDMTEIDNSMFTCANIGPNTVTLTVTDENNNMSSCTSTVTIQDNTAPSAVCTDVTVELDVAGNGSITTGDIDGGSSDACGIASLSLDNTSFNCSDVGANTVTLTVTDNNGNVSTCTATVTVEDNVAPVASCVDITIALDVAGDASITPGDIDGGSTDACGAATSIVMSDFDCSNVGVNVVTLTLTDVNGNISTCDANVTVEDNIAPVASCQAVVVELDAAGAGSITTGDVGAGSSDACGIASLSLDNSSFGCADVGANTVTLTVTDNNSNVSTCTATITVNDNVAPVAVCTDLTIQLDVSGNASITTGDVDAGSSDACGIASITLDNTAFDCNDVGGAAAPVTPSVWINEFHYDNAGGDVGEFIEVAGTAGFDLTGYSLVLYNGSTGAQYDSESLSGTIGDEGNGFGAEFVPASPSLQNGSPDGIALVDGSGTVVEFISYEGSFTASGGPANGLTSTDVGVSEPGTTPIGSSLQLTGTGSAGGDFTWSGPSADSPGSLNAGQTAAGAAAPNTVTLTVTDNNGNVSTCVAEITVEDNIAPVALCMDHTVLLDATGNASIVPGDIDDGSNDACGIASLELDDTDFACADVGTQTVTLTVTDENDNVSTCTAVVTIIDNVAPVAVCQDITVALDAAGLGTITAGDIDDGSSDACGISSITVNDMDFNCSDVGANTVTLTVIDVNSNASTCTATVTVEDNVAPVASCQDLTIQLDVTGNASITTGDVDAGSSDACGIASLSLTDDAFDCTDVSSSGTPSVWINEFHYDNSGTDVNEFIEVAGTAGFDLTGYTLVLYNGSNGTQYDTEPLSGSIGNEGAGFGAEFVLASPSLQNGSPDGIALVDGSGTVVEFISYEGSFTASNGPAAGMTSTVVPIVENSSTPAGQSIQLTGTGTAGADFSWSGPSPDSPGSLNAGQTAAAGTVVTLVVTDNNGNVSTCTSTITIEDKVAPVAACQDVTVDLDAAGAGSITTGDVDNGSSDACGIASITLDDEDFACADVGVQTVTLTVTDNNDNVSTCTADITVNDNVAPVALCQDVTVSLDVAGAGSITTTDVDAGSNDACGIASLSLDNTDFGCANVGANTVTLTVTDNNNNVSTCTATITVNDNVAPVASCQDITVQLNTGGFVSITTASVNDGSSDACGIQSLAIDDNNFGCVDVGANTVTLTVTDNNSNVSTCTSTVTVEDNVAPAAACQPVVVALDAAGTGSITTTDVDAGSSDACGIASLSLDVTDFGCADVGANTVTLTVTDNNTNVSTCTATVTVNDNVAPVALCQDVTVSLDVAGAGSITTTDVDAGSNDACGIFSLSLDNTSFGCGDVGANTVTLTVTDNNANTSTCTATITVNDNVAPVALCQDVTVSLDAAGAGSITTADVDAGSNDACGVTLALDNTTFGCGDVGANTVTLTVTDANSNVSTCTATITVNDNVAPVALCQAVTVELDAAGAGSITTTDVDAGSNDACGVTLALDNTTFGCGDVGANTVTLTVTDANSNVSTCTATITVNDNVAPVALCQDVTVSLDAAGAGSITTTDVDAGSNDACGVTLALDNTTFGCGDVGANTVTLTVTDANSNVSTCTATITVNDNVAPVALCQDVTVSLDAAGAGSITTTDVDAGSNDACGIFSLSLDNTTFGCADVGANTVTLTVTDNNTNVSTCTATITVNDNVAPVALCQAVTVELDAAGAGSITTTDVDAGSNDACGIFSLSLDNTTFGCADVGANTVTLTVTDNNSNVSTCTATITVNDNVAPVALCQAVTVELDAAGAGSITTTDVDAGSNDACGILSLSLDNTTFGCADVGANTVTLTVTDNNGNSTDCTATITVNDNVAPVALCQDVTVELDAAGAGSITTGDVDNGSSDACGIASLSLDDTDFACADVGPNTVTLTVTDNNSNVSTCTSTITVNDNVAPVALCQDVTVELDAAGAGSITTADVDAGSNDACGIASITLDDEGFGCADVGANTVTLTVTDNNSNVSTCTATITVNDNVAPVASCQAVTVELDAAGNGSITTTDVDAGSSDACGIASLALDNTSFNCADVGANTVTLTVTDNNGNVSTCTSTITVNDNVAPVASCQNTTVTLAGGNYSLSAGEVDGGSSDACGIASLSVSPSSFDCTNIGANTVTLTVTDANGNVSTCTATVTVEGIIPVVYVDEMELPDFCQGSFVILTANSDEAVSYAWSTNETTESIEVTADGVYTVTVTSATGCTATTSYTVTGYDPGSLLSAYTIIGIEDVKLYKKNIVNTGGVGVLDCGAEIPGTPDNNDDDDDDWWRVSADPFGDAARSDNDDDDDNGYSTCKNEVTVKKYSHVNSFIQAPEIDVDGTSSSASNTYAPADVTLPMFEYNIYPTNNDVDVPDYANVTLSANIYNKVTIGKHATVTFDADNIYINELKTDDYATVNFTGCANMYINKKVKFDKYTSFNASGQNVIMYVDYSVDVEYGSDITARIYATKDIKVKGKKNKTTSMNGLFIARKVEGKDYVTWNWDPVCDPCAPTAPEDLVETCGECSGGVVELSLTYNGATSATIKVTDKYGDDIYFEDVVTPGETFTFIGEGSYNKLDKNTKVYINGVLDVTIHTSCSQPIGPGVNWGSFTVAAGESKYGGEICPFVPPTGGNDDDDDDDDDDNGWWWRQGSADISYNVYPNPAINKANIDFVLPVTARTTIEVISLTGEIIESIDLGELDAEVKHTFEFKANDLTAGTYIYRIVSGSKVASDKLILVK